jgi:hypothetical protein
MQADRSLTWGMALRCGQIWGKRHARLSKAFTSAGGRGEGSANNLFEIKGMPSMA